MNVSLTKDADKMLVLAYKEYLSRRKNGAPKVEARRFVDGYWASTEPTLHWHSQDISETMLELGRAGLLSIKIGGDCDLTDAAIVYLENRFKNGLKEVLSFLTQFIP